MQGPGGLLFLLIQRTARFAHQQSFCPIPQDGASPLTLQMVKHTKGLSITNITFKHTNTLTSNKLGDYEDYILAEG